MANSPKLSITNQISNQSKIIDEETKGEPTRERTLVKLTGMRNWIRFLITTSDLPSFRGQLKENAVIFFAW